MPKSRYFIKIFQYNIISKNCNDLHSISTSGNDLNSNLSDENELFYPTVHRIVHNFS